MPGPFKSASSSDTSKMIGLVDTVTEQPASGSKRSAASTRMSLPHPVTKKALLGSVSPTARKDFSSERDSRDNLPYSVNGKLMSSSTSSASPNGGALVREDLADKPSWMLEKTLPDFFASFSATLNEDLSVHDGRPDLDCGTEKPVPGSTRSADFNNNVSGLEDLDEMLPCLSDLSSSATFNDDSSRTEHFTNPPSSVTEKPVPSSSSTATSIDDPLTEQHCTVPPPCEAGMSTKQRCTIPPPSISRNPLLGSQNLVSLNGVPSAKNGRAKLPVCGPVTGLSPALFSSVKKGTDLPPCRSVKPLSSSSAISNDDPVASEDRAVLLPCVPGMPLPGSSTIKDASSVKKIRAIPRTATTTGKVLPNSNIEKKII